MDIFFEFTVPLYDSVKHRTKAKQKKLRFATPDVIYEKTDSPKENIDISKKKDILSSQNQTSFF